MNLGDLIRIDGTLWLVRKVDLDLGTGYLAGVQGEMAIVALEDECEVLCNPISDWPCVTLPMRKGRLAAVRHGSQVLDKLRHWVKMDELQIGGSLFLNPELGLGARDRLVIHRGNGRTFNIDIPRSFVPVAQKVPLARAEKPEKPRNPNLFDHLMED